MKTLRNTTKNTVTATVTLAPAVNPTSVTAASVTAPPATPAVSVTASVTPTAPTVTAPLVPTLGASLLITFPAHETVAPEIARNYKPGLFPAIVISYDAITRHAIVQFTYEPRKQFGGLYTRPREYGVLQFSVDLTACSYVFWNIDASIPVTLAAPNVASAQLANVSVPVAPTTTAPIA